MNDVQKQMIDEIFQDPCLKNSTFKIRFISSLTDEIIDYYISKVNQKNFDSLISSDFVFLAAGNLTKFTDNGFIADDKKIKKGFDIFVHLIHNYGPFKDEDVIKKLYLKSAVNMTKHLIDSGSVPDSKIFSLCPSVMRLYNNVSFFRRVINIMKLLSFSDSFIYEKGGEICCSGNITTCHIDNFYFYYFYGLVTIPIGFFYYGYNIKECITLSIFASLMHFSFVSTVRFFEIGFRLCKKLI